MAKVGVDFGTTNSSIIMLLKDETGSLLARSLLDNNRNYERSLIYVQRTGEIKATRGLGRSFSKSAIEAYFKARNGKKIYLEIIKDLATKQVLTWAISEHPNLRFALTPL